MRLEIWVADKWGGESLSQTIELVAGECETLTFKTKGSKWPELTDDYEIKVVLEPALE